MKIVFQIDYIYHRQDEVFIFAILLNKKLAFSLTKSSTLGSIPIKNQLNMPRSLDENGNPRFDIFIFYPKVKSDIKHFNVGDIWELIP